MLKANLWNKSVPKVELDQRARDGRLRLEQIERLLVIPRAAATHFRLRRLAHLHGAGESAGVTSLLPQARVSRTRRSAIAVRR